MAVVVANIQTTVVMDEWYEKQKDLVCNSTMHITVDPITMERECEVYTDDGKGNGVLIFKFKMS